MPKKIIIYYFIKSVVSVGTTVQGFADWRFIFGVRQSHAIQNLDVVMCNEKFGKMSVQGTFFAMGGWVQLTSQHVSASLPHFLNNIANSLYIKSLETQMFSI